VGFALLRISEDKVSGGVKSATYFFAKKNGEKLPG